MRLERYDNDGLELFINLESGECFASQSGLARMCGVSETSIQKWRTVNQIEVKMAEIPTATGIKTATLFDENLIYQALAKYNSKLLIQCARAGLRFYLHKIAGFSFELISPLSTSTQKALLTCELAEKTSEAIKKIQENLADTQPRLAQWLIEKATWDLQKVTGESQPLLPPAEELLTCEAYASELGFPVNKNNRCQLGKFVAKAYRETHGEPIQQKQECAGALRSIKVYPRSFLADIIPIFFS